MRWFTLSLVSVFALPAAAFAACEGEDMLQELTLTDPGFELRMEARADTAPNGEGLFWAVDTADGVRSWLYGTYHDTEVAKWDLSENAENALKSARVMLVELTDAEEQRLNERISSDPGFSFTQSPSGLTTAFSEEQKAVAQSALATRGLTLEMAERMKPWLLFASLGFPLCQLEAIRAGELILDKVLAKIAREADVPVRGLETYEQALGAFDRIPPDLLDDLMLDLVSWTSREQDLRRTNVAFYRAERVAAIWAFSLELAAGKMGEAASLALADAFEDAVLKHRNEAWMERLSAEVAEGGAFVAVGALHLPGHNGLIELLRARGFTVTRVPL